MIFSSIVFSFLQSVNDKKIIANKLIGRNLGYSYDLVDNRLTSSGINGLWTYNKNNELISYGNVSFEYDKNGNLSEKRSGTENIAYIYDISDRLIRVEKGNGSIVAQYGYDPFGRRLWKEVSGVKTYFLYSDEGLIGEYDASGKEIKTYGYAPNSLWSTDPLFQKIKGAYYWYQNDHLGTPQKVTDSTGRLVWSASYDSFGNCQIATAGIENNLRFPGQYYDAETGLYYNWNRYYDPITGRYLKIDPYKEGINFYTYAVNNPVSSIDPHGLCVIQVLCNTRQGFCSNTGNDTNYLSDPNPRYAKETFDAYNVEGNIDIKETADGKYRVFVAGTEFDREAFELGNNPLNWIPSAFGVNDSYSNYIRKRITEEIPPGSIIEVMGGHSLGGMEIQNLAPSLSKFYTIERVETYGSPALGKDFPGTTYSRHATPGDPVVLADPRFLCGDLHSLSKQTWYPELDTKDFLKNHLESYRRLFR